MDAIFTILWYLFIAVQIFFASFLLQPVIQLLIYWLLKLFGYRSEDITQTPVTKNYHFGVIVTAHRETTFIRPIVDSLLKQTYPHFRVYVVADDCDITGLHFNDTRIQILKPPVAFNTNSKSIQYAIEHFRDEDEIMLLFDPDNLVHPKFLEIMNAYYNKGYKAAQGNLYSKNIEGAYEKMDSVGRQK
jgi:cellulose synthase/poly-beta-1,6-N-acetylglucosamine synthase-like glycosyltransferase